MRLIIKYKRIARELIMFVSIIIFISLLLVSCRPTKYVPTGSFLLDKVKVKCNNKSIDNEALLSYIKQKPNRKILGVIKFHLGLYNLVDPDKELSRQEKRQQKREEYNEKRKRKGKRTKDKQGFSEWLLKIGEAPVIYDTYQTYKTKRQLELYLKNKGYYNAEITDTVFFKRKKAKVFFTLKANEPYAIKDLSYKIGDQNIHQLVVSDSLNSVIKKGGIFDVDLMQQERNRVTKLLKNNGYYYFAKEYIYYQVDSALNSNQVNVTLDIKDVAGNAVQKDHRQYKVNDIYIYVDYDPRLAMQNYKGYIASFDTLDCNGYKFIYVDKLTLNPSLILASNYIQKGKYYNQSNVEETYNRLSSLKNFKFINIKFYQPQDTFFVVGRELLLDCHIQLSSVTKQSYSVEIEGKNSSGALGFESNLNYQHKSLFRGAEIFDFKVRGSIEAQPGVVDNKTQQNELIPFNTREFGFETGIQFPKFLLPVKSDKFIKRFHPRTSITAGYNNQDRPDYTRTITNASFGYYWEAGEYIRNVFNPIRVNSVKIYAISDDFQERIQNKYIRYSYEDFFISETNYSFEFNNQDIKRRKDFVYLRGNIETGGNILTGIFNLTKEPKYEESYKLFDTKYAQFAKADIDLRYYNHINEGTQIVYRGFIGVGYPYGNLKVLPFIKQYFSGGANSIRAWQVRSLGPGSYQENISYLPNRTADIKLEANIEYRFDLFSMLEGAFYIDAGNIWSINKEDDREGSLFEINRFYKEIAVGTGFGARFDFSFFIFRLDTGFKVIDPQENIGERFVWASRGLLWRDFAVNVGIGYPF